MKPLLAALSLSLLTWPAHAAERKVTLLITGDNRAEVAPCGCRNEPSGGLARRKAALDAHKGKALVLDAGNALFKLPDPANQDEKTRASFIMRTMGRLGTKVMGVGERDLPAGLAFLQAEAKAAGVTLLSANLTLDGKRALEGSKVLTVNGVKVAVIGVSGGEVAPLALTSAADAVEAELATLAARDLTVLIAAMPRRGAVELGNRLAGKLDIVVQSSDGMGMDQAAHKLRTGGYMLGAGQLGEGIGKLTVSLDGAGPLTDKNEVTPERGYLAYLDYQVSEAEAEAAATKQPGARREASKRLAELKAQRTEYSKGLPARPTDGRGFTWEWLKLGVAVKDDPGIRAEALKFEPTYSGNR